MERYGEAPITFEPTYKYDKNSNTYDTSKKFRTPAWFNLKFNFFMRFKLKFKN